MSLPTTSRPTIDLAIIVKNERKNLPRLIASLKDCFDNIHVTDTGSNDGTVEWLKSDEPSQLAGCPVHTHYFQWVNSFCKARNYSFSHAKSDYVMWLDADDVLSEAKAFIQWRDHTMKFHGAWAATYNYALDNTGKPIISFMRERVFKTEFKPEFLYDIHEGVVLKPEWQASYAVSWAVNHMRDEEDMKADKSRNVKILEEMTNKDARLKFYYGKELFESNRSLDALPAFDEALKDTTLEFHDRLLALQYAGQAAITCFQMLKEDQAHERAKFFDKAIYYATEGIKADPNRAEFYILAGDMYIKMGMLDRAIPYFNAAKSCTNNKTRGAKFEGAIYSQIECYGRIPSIQLSRLYMHTGQVDKALKEAKECFEAYQDKETEDILKEVLRIKSLTNLNNGQAKTGDIVFSCPPQQAYEFDEELYKTKPMGGSETALIQMAKFLKKKTGRSVKVFNQRAADLVADSGVEYIPNSKLNEYLSKNSPNVHIAWRHNIKLTNAPTYLWCHDLMTQTVEMTHSFDKIMCLSQFHKDFVMGMQGVPEEKIMITRNGITPEKLKVNRRPKNANKFVYMSSPDRGLGRAMMIMDEVVKKHPETELHIYYGIEGLEKYGRKPLGDHLKSMMSARSYIKYHGFTEQNKMYEEVSDAVIWLHPATFIETFCITALEMSALNIFPITRKLGALKDTLGVAEKTGQAILMDQKEDGLDQNGLEIPPSVVQDYVNAVDMVLKEKMWEHINFDQDYHSWETVADEWIKEFNL